MPKKVEISHRTIIFTVFFLISLYFLYQIRQILVVFFISFVLMSALNPTVKRLEKVKIPRVLAILILYLLVFVVLGLSIAGIIPPLVDQTATLISRLPDYFETLPFLIVNQGFVSSQISQLGSIPANLVKLTVSIFNNLIALLVVAVVTFYFLIEREKLDHYLAVLFGGNGKDKAKAFIDKLEHRLGGWVRAQLTLMVIVGVMSYIGLRLLRIEFALPLALLAGILEVVPNIGPILSAIPAVLAGLVISPLMGLAVAALYFLVQQLENTLIVPQIMAREVGVRPLVVIISLAVGAKLAGFIGVLLAIPFMLLLQITISEFFSSEKFKQL